MGNIKNKKSNTDDSEKFIVEFFKNTGLEFNAKEMINFKLSITDAQKYFYTKFDYFMFFNNYVFKERLSILYDNFNSKIEESANKGSLSILINFDESELNNINQGSKPDFDSLFTIIMERLEIGVLLYFNLTNLHHSYIDEFFYQMTDSIELYKYNRKFDCLYFLLPNMDYFIKNDVGIYYISNRIIQNPIVYKSKFLSSVFSHNSIQSLIDCKYIKNETNEFFNYFLESSKPTLIKVMLSFDFDDLVNFDNINYEQMNNLNMLMNHSRFIHIIVDIKKYENDSHINIIRLLVIKLISFTETSDDNKFKLTLVSENKKERLTIQNLDNVITELHKYFATKIFTKKKHRLIVSLYFITHEEGLIFRTHYDNIDLTWGGIDITFYTVYYIINKNSNFKKLQNENIISTLSSFLNKNYCIVRTKKKNLSKREDYIQTIYN